MAGLEDTVSLPVDRSRTVGIVLMLASAFFFSIMGALVKYTTHQLPFMEVVFFRSSINVLVILPVMFKRRIALVGNNLGLLFMRSLLGFVALALTFYVTSKLKLADAAILNQTSGPFVALFAALFLREKLSLLLCTCIAACFVGAALIIKPSPDFINLPGILGLLSGACAAAAYICVKKLHQSEQPLTIVFSFSAFSTVFAALLMFPFFVWPNLLTFSALLGLGFSGSLGQILFTYAYRYAPASEISPFLFTSVAFSAVLGALYWGELPDLWSLVGIVMITLSGVVIVRRPGARSANLMINPKPN